MSALFLTILHMSVCASWLVLAVLLLRLCLRRAPKWFNVLLWGIVAVRLIFPFSVESPLSLLPHTEAIRPAITTVQTQPAQISSAAAAGGSAAPAQSWLSILAWVWLAGAAALLLYTMVSTLRLRHRVREAVRLRGNIYQSERIDSPFVLGTIRPRIYLPYRMDSRDRQHVIAHEQAHLRRGDHLWKPLGFLLLTIHWFNPVMWLSYVLLCRDIELACDERVVRDMTREDRAAYSQALLQCSLNRRRRLVLCPLAFGEVDVRTRVKSVLRYRRPAVWLSAAAVLLCAALAVTFLTEPKTAENAPAEKTRTHNNDYVDYFQRIQKKEAQQGRSVDNPVVIISTSMEPATSQISYQVQLLDGMTDWEKERILSRYNMNIANMEIFYPQEGDIYQEMDVPHLRFRAVSSTSVPPIDPAYDDLVALDNPYEPYTLASVTVLSADGSQSSTFRRVGQSLLLDDAPDDSGRNAISWSIRID